MNKYALTVENLTKVYSDSKNKKENKALNDLNFQVKQGEVFGLLGPNKPNTSPCLTSKFKSLSALFSFLFLESE